jgi:hypothetical protein
VRCTFRTLDEVLAFLRWPADKARRRRIMFNGIRVNARSLVLAILFLALMACGAPEPISTPVPPADTPVPPTETPVPPTDTPLPPTDTPVPPTDTPVPPTATPTPEPPTDTPSPSATPTLEAKIQATSAEEIVGEYFAGAYDGGAAIPGYSYILVLGEDGSFSTERVDEKGSHRGDGPHGTWRFEDGLLVFEYRVKCVTSGGRTEGIVGTYEVHYRLLGGDKPARLYFTPVDDQCEELRTDWRREAWNRYEP